MTASISPETAISRLVTEFSRHGWTRETGVAIEVVRRVMRSGGEVDAKRLAAAIPRLFVSANNATRSDVQGAIERAMGNVKVSPDA